MCKISKSVIRFESVNIYLPMWRQICECIHIFVIIFATIMALYSSYSIAEIWEHNNKFQQVKKLVCQS